MKVLELKFSCSTHEKVGKFRKRENKNEATSVGASEVRCDARVLCNSDKEAGQRSAEKVTI
jgi:hypothetical protein